MTAVPLSKGDFKGGSSPHQGDLSKMKRPCCCPHAVVALALQAPLVTPDPGQELPPDRPEDPPYGAVGRRRSLSWFEAPFQ